MKTHRTTASQRWHFAGLRSAFLVAFILFGSMVSAHGAGVFRVDAASTAPTPDGQSWETAYTKLHAAASAAAAAGGGELWVKGGTYTSSGDQVVSLADGVALYGGFDGTETDRTQRDWNANPTFIDGQHMRRCVYCTGSGTGSVDGFTVMNGLHADSSNTAFGGGMYRGMATNCTFIGNSARGDGGDAAFGGGMYGGTATNCTFIGNIASKTFYYAFGGGMYGGTATNCTFTGNSANGVAAAGGGLHSGMATNCTFTGNSANAIKMAAAMAEAYGGGMYGGTATNCTFTGNSASAIDGTSSGGGMSGGTATNCSFMGNVATEIGGSSFGGGMHNGATKNCIFWLNTAASDPELSGMTSVTYSCVRGGYAGEGNIADNPKFANAPHDLRLQPGSPCLDTGTAVGAPADDIAGIARPQGAGVDMGAYESAALGVPHAPVVGADASGANPPTWTWTPGGGGIGQYRFGFAEGMWEAVDLAAAAYTPPIPLPAGSHTLYVQERDALGNWSASGAHTLTVTDTAPPAGAIFINGNAATTASSTVALALTWDDGLNGSGVSRMRFSNDGTTWSPWERAASLKSWTLSAGMGYKTVRAQFLDRSGNRSAVCSDYIKVVAP